MTATDKTDSTELAEPELVTATIDGIEVSVPKGTLVIRAAELLGTAIPRFCDHPLLEPAGACRQCLVEVTDDGRGRGMPKPQPSCTLELMPGMQVSTQVTSPVADKAQHGQMEFLLINHPLDCPICDKGGECPLQNQAMSNGRGETRYEGVKRTYPKPINVSPQVLLDRERCILCARCTRFSEQIAGDPMLVMAERGALQQVAIYEKEPFQSYFSGNTIQICPVGALTSAIYRFRSRPFDLVSTPAIGEHDACGAAIRVDHRRGEVMRRQAGDDPEVNEEWITDRDRFAFRSHRGNDRITTPLVRDGDVLRPASWPEAIDAAATGLRKAIDASTAGGSGGASPSQDASTVGGSRGSSPSQGASTVGGSRGSSPSQNIGVLTGGRLTRENAYGYSKFARTALRTNSIDFRSRPASEEEAAFLTHAVAGTGMGVSYADLENASGVLLVALEPEDEAGTIFLRMRKANRAGRLPSWTLAPYLSYGAQKSGTVLVPTTPGTEAEVLGDLPPEVELDERSVILVGERAALAPGALTAVLGLAERTGARLAWVPRRAGDRGAVDAGCLPAVLPGGRPVSDASARVDTQATWGVESLPTDVGLDATAMLERAEAGLLALVVAGVEPNDFADPSAVRAGLENAPFVVSLEARESEVTERADVVLPVALVEQQAGSFVNWEGRERPFDAVLPDKTTMTDLRVLAALADALGGDLGVRTTASAAAELSELGAWDGSRARAPRAAGATDDDGARETGAGQVVLATWREMIDASRSNDNEKFLMASGRPAVARVGARTARDLGLGARIVVSTDAGAIELPCEVVGDMVNDVVWIPSNAPGLSVTEHLRATAGATVTLAPVTSDPAPAASDEDGEGK